MAAQPMIPVMQTGKAGQPNPWQLLAQAAPKIGTMATNAVQGSAGANTTMSNPNVPVTGPGYAGGPQQVAGPGWGGQGVQALSAPAFRILQELFRRRLNEPAVPVAGGPQ